MGCTKLIEMDIETNSDLPAVASKPCTHSLTHQERVIKELEDLEKNRNYPKKSFPLASPIVVLPQNVHQVHQCKRQKDIVSVIEN